jgi:hypothetical protein
MDERQPARMDHVAVQALRKVINNNSIPQTKQHQHHRKQKTIGYEMLIWRFTSSEV